MSDISRMYMIHIILVRTEDILRNYKLAKDSECKFLLFWIYGQIKKFGRILVFCIVCMTLAETKRKLLKDSMIALYHELKRDQSLQI